MKQAATRIEDAEYELFQLPVSAQLPRTPCVFLFIRSMIIMVSPIWYKVNVCR